MGFGLGFIILAGGEEGGGGGVFVLDAFFCTGFIPAVVVLLPVRALPFRRCSIKRCLSCATFCGACAGFVASFEVRLFCAAALLGLEALGFRKLPFLWGVSPPLSCANLFWVFRDTGVVANSNNVSRETFVCCCALLVVLELLDFWEDWVEWFDLWED
jgi:hypothetical protein